MKDKFYFPRIKTTPAELKAFDNLSGERKVLACPILELTKGIKENIEVQIKRIRTYIGEDQCFILDLTQDETFQDRTIKDFQNEHQDGYKKWCQFLNDINFENLIPSLTGSLQHLGDFIKQIEFFDKYFENGFAYRIPISLEDDIQDLKLILKKVLISNVKRTEKVYLLLDFKSLQIEDVALFEAKIDEIKSVLLGIGFMGTVLPMFSSYPQVPPPNDNRDEFLGEGSMPISEFELHRVLVNSKFPFKYSDYAYIQPVRKPTGGGLWLPRIDFPTWNKCYWVRYHNKEIYTDKSGNRRVKTHPTNETAYKRIAEKVVSEPWYNARNNYITCWGTEEIQNAARGDVGGKSPQHWIAVRANIHMSRVIDLISLI
jgi:hypothetical protein